MERIIIKTQSVSDVITNSSTEIYTVCTEYTLDRLKDIVNSILKIADSTLTADDLFTFELDKVIPKKENYTEAAKYLSNIMDIFEQAASFES